MTRIGLALLCGVVLLAACGDDEDGTSVADARADGSTPVPDANPNAPDANPNAPDANPTPDANQTGPVRDVTCDGTTPVLTVTAEATYKYTGTATRETVPAGSVVRFDMPKAHNAVSGANRTADDKFLVDFKTTKCLVFTVADTYPFYCSRHNPYEGSITVITP